MILVADGGSTKVDWICLDEKGIQIFKTRTKNVNPILVSTEIIKKRILTDEYLKSIAEKVFDVYFYGAGCSTQKSCDMLSAIFKEIFTIAKNNVEEDMLAAVYAASKGKEAIVAILGTGSNSCYYDGKTMTTNSISLGHMIMDEASGNYFGKCLLRDYYYKKIPSKICKAFAQEYDLNVDNVTKKLYSSDSPNTYLASFATFMFKFKTTDYIRNLINKGFEDFFNYRILPYHKDKSVPIYFIGSIAHYFGDLLEDVAHSKGLKIEGIIQRPIDNLVAYHRDLLLQKG